MSLEVKVAELATIMHATLGPDGSHTKLLQELRIDFKTHVAEDAKTALDVHELKRVHKNRLKVVWLAMSAVVILAVDAAWSKFFHKG